MFVRLIAICIILTVPLGGSLSAGFRAGAAKADITPTHWPVDMVASFSRLADQAWDPLHARALILSGSCTTIAIVTVDSCT